MKTLLCLVLLLIGSLNAMAASGYRIVHPDGSVEYTDEPKPGAEKVPLPQAPAYQSAPLPRITPPPPVQKPVSVYQSIRITSPKAESTHHRNTGPLNVAVSVSPALQGDDEIALYFDGKLLSKNQSGVFTIQEPDRGAHTLQAAIEDKTGDEILKSDTITVYVRQPSILIKPHKAP